MPQQQVPDYEVVALAYRAVQDCEQESEAFEHALSIADLRPREVLPSHTSATPGQTTGAPHRRHNRGECLGSCSCETLDVVHTLMGRGAGEHASR